MANKRHIPGALLRLAAVVATLVALATACTQNNGYIGNWFGAWTMTSIEADGTPLADYDSGSLTWKFQSTVVNMTLVEPYHVAIDYFGTWQKLSDTQLELNFTHRDYRTPSGTDYYSPPTITHLPAAISVLQIRQFTSKRLVLEYTDPTDGVTYTYRLAR